MIHRAPFGSMERFVAVLIEHTGGKFPLWLAPDQVVVMPISEKFNDYAQKLSDLLNNSVRRQGQGDMGTMSVEDFISKINEEVNSQLQTIYSY